MERYDRQLRFKELSEEDQQKLLLSRVAIVGAGAVGSATAEMLARAGAGYIRVIDSDEVELSNLQRQMIFTEKDIGRDKAEACAEFLRAVNSDVEAEAFVVMLGEKNAGELLSGVDIILDSTDNMAARFVINDYSIRTGTPWIYAAAAGATASMMVIIPRKTACLRCVFPKIPRKELTAQTAGILNQATTGIASLRAVQAMKLLTGKPFMKGVLYLDAWQPSLSLVKVKKRPDCPACGEGK